MRDSLLPFHYRPVVKNLTLTFCPIYPSQRQNLLPTLEILIQNFENFQIFKILEKNSQIQNFFPKFPKPQRGRHWHQRGRRLLTTQLQNFHFFQEFPKLGVYNIKHNLARSCFQFWLSKSAPRVTKFWEKNCLG